MNWERAKTLMIFLLITVNIVLGGVLLARHLEESNLNRRAIADLLEILESNGLAATADLIPDTETYALDVELTDLDTGQNEEMLLVNDLPIWSSVSGNWRWDDALPVRNTASRSAGQALLLLTSGWDKHGTLEESELGFIPNLITPEVLRLYPTWRFVISGEEYFV